MPYRKRVAKIFEPAFTREGGLRWSGSGTDQIGVGNGNAQMSSNLICQQQCLIKFSLAEPFVVQRNWYDQVDVIQAWQCGQHQVGEGRHEGHLAPVLQQADRILERRNIGIERPGSGIGRWTFHTGIAQMLGTVGGRH